MGAPKQKWTSEEENALKAGIAKHGSGKWRTILKDPEFSGVLLLRSNVDLKDKWRNMCVMTSGFGSRSRAASKRSHESVSPDEDTLDMTEAFQSDEDSIDAKLLEADNEVLPKSGSSKKSIARMDNLVLEAITTLKEPRGSNRTNIAMYIEDQYDAPPNLNRVLSEKLKDLTSNGRLIKVNRKYRIGPGAAFSEVTRNSAVPPLEAMQRGSPRAEKVEVRILTQSKVEAEIAKMRTMTAKEAAAAAARAVAEAEAAMAEAEEAAKEAEAAEADAEAAQAFAEAAMITLKNRNTPNLMVHG